MPQKIIPNLQPRSEVTDGVNFPLDDGIQSYRVSALQIKNYILALGNIATGMIADAAVTRAKLALGAVGRWDSATLTGTANIDPDKDITFINTSGGAFTATLPSASSNAGRVITLKKIGSDYNAGTIAGTIDGVTNFVLYMPYDSITVFSNGTNWNIVHKALQPVIFKAQKNGGSVSGNTIIPSWSAALVDTVGGFNNTSGKYTIKIPGNWKAHVNLNVTSGTVDATIVKGSTQQAYGTYVGSASSGDSVSTILENLSVNDEIATWMGGSRTLVSDAKANFFEMQLIR